MSYISAEKVESQLIDALNNEEYANMNKVIDLSSVPFIDVDGVKAIETAYKRHNNGGEIVFLLGDHEFYSFLKSNFYNQLETEQRIEQNKNELHLPSLFENKKFGEEAMEMEGGKVEKKGSALKRKIQSELEDSFTRV